MGRTTFLTILVLSGISCALLTFRTPVPNAGPGVEQGSVPACATHQRPSEFAGKNHKAARSLKRQHEVSGSPAGPDKTRTAEVSLTAVAPSVAGPAPEDLHSPGEPAAAAVREERHRAWLTAKTRKDRPHAGLTEFPVPVSLASLPLPVYLVHRTPAVSAAEAGEIPNSGTASSEPATDRRQDSTVGEATISNAAVAEATAIEHAEGLFFDAMTAAPVVEAESPEYAEWWNAAQFRSDEYLRATLGWDRFNRLTAAQLEQVADSRAR